MYYENELFPTAICFNMQAAPFGASPSRLYPAAFDMMAYADEKGVDRVEFQEHHGSPDGYVPTPFLMGAAAAARTKRMAIILGAIILPLHDPVEVAEQIAVGDLISGGRQRVVLAGGYSPKEFEAFGVSLRDRGRLMEEGIDVVLRALSGERFTYQGRPVFVRPLPQSPPHEIVFGGGGVDASARRVARFGLPIWPMNDSMIAPYDDECRKLGRKPGPIARRYELLYISEDPERGWREIGDHLLHVVKVYAGWSESFETSTSPFHGMDTLEKAKAIMDVVTPEQAIELGRKGPIGLMPLVGGLDPNIAWKSLELFVDKVLPKIKGANQINTIARSGP